VYVLLNDVEYKADYGLDRPDVAMGQKNQKYFPCGFKLQKKATMLEDGEYIIKVRGINVKGNEYYELLYPGSIHIKSKGIFAPFFRFKGMAFRKSRRAMCLLLGFLKEPFFFFSLLKNLGIILFETKRRKKIALVNLDEHIGDIVACEPVSRIVRKESPDAYILWLTKYRYKSLVQHNPAIDLTLGLTCLFEWVVLKTLIKKLIPALKLIDLHIHKRLCTSFGVESKNENDYGIALENYFSYGNILETFLMAANLPKNDLPPLFYFKKGFRVKVPLNCIVLHCSSNELSKDWEDQKWNDLAALLTGAGYQVAEVGLHNKLGTVHSSYDFCGKLSLQGIAFFIKKSKLFIGIDSAFAHVANAVDTPGVILLGHYRRFQKYMPYSGRYKNGHNATVIQYNGYVKDIPTQIVFEAVIERLKLSKGRDEYFL
jgi:ADP-heptose:LPS heptosyltransferase